MPLLSLCSRTLYGSQKELLSSITLLYTTTVLLSFSERLLFSITLIHSTTVHRRNCCVLSACFTTLPFTERISHLTTFLRNITFHVRNCCVLSPFDPNVRLTEKTVVFCHPCLQGYGPREELLYFVTLL